MNQGKFQVSAEPAQRYLDLLSSAISSGRAHLATTKGDQPTEAGRFGWRSFGDAVKMEPQGDRVGWVDPQTSAIFVEPTAAYRLAQSMAAGDPLPVNLATLNKRLHEKKHLASVEDSRATLTVRRTIEGRRIPVLHLKPSALCLIDPTEPDEDPGHIAEGVSLD